ncbi:hypothetical protein BJ546DRAFT_64642 [Cryomyces antarcticus]
MAPHSTNLLMCTAAHMSTDPSIHPSVHPSIPANQPISSRLLSSRLSHPLPDLFPTSAEMPCRRTSTEHGSHPHHNHHHHHHHHPPPTKLSQLCTPTRQPDSPAEPRCCQANKAPPTPPALAPLQHHPHHSDTADQTSAPHGPRASSSLRSTRPAVGIAPSRRRVPLPPSLRHLRAEARRRPRLLSASSLPARSTRANGTPPTAAACSASRRSGLRDALPCWLGSQDPV